MNEVLKDGFWIIKTWKVYISFMFFYQIILFYNILKLFRFIDFYNI
jgi:hypothetical protein